MQGYNIEFNVNSRKKTLETTATNMFQYFHGKQDTNFYQKKKRTYTGYRLL
jgi:hypothetical protein